MTSAAMDFLNYLRPGGVVIYNESLVDTGTDRDDVKSLAVPVTGIADDLKQEPIGKDIRDTKMFANAVMFGAFLQTCAPMIGEERIKETLKYFLQDKKAGLIPINYLAITKGKKFVQANPLQDHKVVSPFHCIPSWATQ